MVIKNKPQIGNTILRKKSLPVKNFESKSVGQSIGDLVDTMRADGLIGLSAPQLGRSLRIFVTEIRKTKYRTKPKQLHKLAVYINPRIVELSKDTEVGFEGCGSVFNAQLFGPVRRAKSVVVEAYNESGQKFKAEESGLMARVIQHEYDHLEGILFTDKITDWQKILSVEEYLKRKNHDKKK